VNIQKEEIFI